MYCIAVQEIYGKLPVRASLYYLKDNKTIDYIPDESSIAAFRERVSAMIGLGLCRRVCGEAGSWAFTDSMGLWCTEEVHLIY